MQPLELNNWAPLSVPAQGALWDKWAKVKDFLVDRPDGVTNMVDVHHWTRNHIRYVREPVAADVWQAPNITIKIGAGDCEDFAILDRALLRAVGYKTRDMALLILSEPISGYSELQDHAVMFCGDYYLDCRAGDVLHKSQFKDCRPIFAFTDDAMFLYGRRR